MGKTRKQRIKNNSRAKTIKNNKQLVNVRENLDGGALFANTSCRVGIYEKWGEKGLINNVQFKAIRGFLRKSCLFFLRGTYTRVVGNDKFTLGWIKRLFAGSVSAGFQTYSEGPWLSADLNKIENIINYDNNNNTRYKTFKTGGEFRRGHSINNNKAMYFFDNSIDLDEVGSEDKADSFLFMIQSVVGMSDRIFGSKNENAFLADSGNKGVLSELWANKGAERWRSKQDATQPPAPGDKQTKTNFRTYGVLGVGDKFSQKVLGSNRDSEYFKKFRERAFLINDKKRSFQNFDFLNEDNILDYIIYLLIMSYPVNQVSIDFTTSDVRKSIQEYITNMDSEGYLYNNSDTGTNMFIQELMRSFDKDITRDQVKYEKFRSSVERGYGYKSAKDITDEEVWFRYNKLYQGTVYTEHSATDLLTPEASSDILFWRTGFAHALTELAQRLLFTKKDINALINNGFKDISLKGDVKQFPERKDIMSVTSLLLLRYLTLQRGDIGAGAVEMSNSTEPSDVWSQGNQLPKIILMMRLFRFVCLQDPGVGKFWRKRATISGGAKDDYSDDVIVGGDMQRALGFNTYKFNTSTIRMNNRLNEAAAQLFINRDIQINIEPKAKK